jgi:quinohemoprotein ethanol dehydrogenase
MKHGSRLGAGLVVVMLAALLTLAVARGGGGESGAAAATSPIEVAPAFSAEQLASAPSADGWLTNGGSTLNQRYSPLDQITPENVAGLKGVWLSHLRGSGAAAKYSGEAQPLVYRGTAYVVTGADDVFAVDVRTGTIRWQYKAGLTDRIPAVCCGWTSRGVAVGDGKVYVGQLDGRLVALDQRTGQKVWTSRIESYKNGYTITSAPLYHDGLVYTGISGGEFQARGRVTAVDAATGKIRWRFYTSPGPGEVGHSTWPKNSSWKRGGAPVWQTPALDPQLGLLYFSTGNAAPDDDGHARAGDNLFSSSIVAIDAKTGKHRWHFQMVHHDIWDYDSPSPVVLFDVEIGGVVRHALAEAGKTGWVYTLDRVTGEPLHGITEKPVPQNRWQRTAKTQPFPDTPPVVPHTVSANQFKEIVALARKSKETRKLKPVRGSIFTPVQRGKLVVVAPGPAGGTNWPPSSYNPKTQMLYVCATATAAGYSVGLTRPPKEVGKSPYLGSVWTLNGIAPNPGVLAAVDVRTGRIAWKAKWKDACYSGSVTTGGNLVFAGRNNGELEAYDARDGRRVWRFQTGAGANSTATVFEQDGQQRILFYAAGNALAGTAHGDNLWLFGLDGKLGPVKPGSSAAALQHAGEGTSRPSTRKGNVVAGRKVWTSSCSSCHGFRGRGGNGGPDLLDRPNAKVRAKVIRQIQRGGRGMPAFQGALTDKQIADVTAYVLRITGGK